MSGRADGIGGGFSERAGPVLVVGEGGSGRYGLNLPGFLINETRVSQVTDQ
jgi:hypothetical protein